MIALSEWSRDGVEGRTEEGELEEGRRKEDWVGCREVRCGTIAGKRGHQLVVCVQCVMCLQCMPLNDADAEWIAYLYHTS